MMIKTTKLYVLISVWMTLTFTHCHSLARNHSFWVHFLGSFADDLDEIQYAPQPVGFVEAYARFILERNIQGRELSWHCMKYTFNIFVCQDTSEPICFIHCMMLNTAKLFDSCLSDLDIHSRSQAYGRVKTFAVILLWSCMKHLNVHGDWLYKGDDCEVL